VGLPAEAIIQNLSIVYKEDEMTINLGSFAVSITLAFLIVAAAAFILTRPKIAEAIAGFKVGLPLAIAAVMIVAIFTGTLPAWLNNERGPEWQRSFAESGAQAEDITYAYDPADDMVWPNTNAAEYGSSVVDAATERNHTTVSRQDAAQAAAGAQERCSQGDDASCIDAMGPAYVATQELGQTKVRVIEFQIGSTTVGFDVSFLAFVGVFILVLAIILSRKTKAA